MPGSPVSISSIAPIGDGFTAQLWEAGDGVGGTWYWNRYPGARFDSESYTYAYLFSRELFDEWEWQERFAEQPETERYFNHVVDRFDLRRHIRFGAAVTSAEFDEPSGTWMVTTRDGSEIRVRYLIAATGILSVPFYPDVPGRQDFRGMSIHTGRWPSTPVDVAGKRVAVIGTGSSGVQVIPAIAGDVAALTVYQRSANWCTPLNNAAISPEEQRQLRADFEAMCAILNTSASGFLHPVHDRKTFDDPIDVRRAFFEAMWNSPGFSKLTSNYLDLTIDHDANALWCEFIADKIRGLVDRPRDGRQAHPERPSLRREAPSIRDRLLRDLQQAERVTDRSQANAHGADHRERDRDDGGGAGIRPHHLGDRLRFRYRCTASPGDPGPERPGARGLLGGWAEDIPGPPDHRFPEPVLSRRSARGGGQQSALQRRSGRLRRRHTRVPSPARVRHH